MSRRKPAGKGEGRSKEERSSRSGRPRDADDVAEVNALAQRHRRFGWRALFVFLLLGLFLEGLHALKVGWYLEVAGTTRRLMWTLAHAHGTLLAVVNLVLAATIVDVPAWASSRRRLASACLLGASILLPVGFFLGGWFTNGGDPGIGVALVPVGAVLLLTAVLLAGRA